MRSRSFGIERRSRRRPNRLSEAVIGVVVLTLVAIGSFLLPAYQASAGSDDGAKAGVTIERMTDEATGLQPVLK
jgi:hypothetical protein